MPTTLLNKPSTTQSTSPHPDYAVTQVIPHSDYTLELTFADRTHKLFDLKPYLDKPYYSPLKDLQLFMTAHIKYHTVVWNEALDLAPDYLYSTSTPL